GRIINMTGFDMPPTVCLDPVIPDEKVILSVADSTGVFVIRAVPPGSYVVTTFIDLKSDSVCGDYTQPEDSTIMLKEPCYTCPDTLVVYPGETKTLEPINLESKGTDAK
ncbi:MAG: hypothetical protein KAX38_02475, partial [Candidatus Krumholzibacteria bacterium]|nr:hypothetical protein [Candidatus Krumholzibacteria bacterium]